MAIIKSVQRTRIVLEGEIPEEYFRKILGAILETEKFFNIRHDYDKNANETILWLLPCKSYAVKLAESSDEFSDQRNILVNGPLPNNLNFIKDIWMPFKKKAKNMKRVEGYITLLLYDVSEDDCNGHCTNIRMIIDSRCDKELIPAAFKVAVRYIAEELRKLAEEANPTEFFAASYLDQLSMLVAETIEQYDGQYDG